MTWNDWIKKKNECSAQKCIQGFGKRGEHFKNLAAPSVSLFATSAHILKNSIDIELHSNKIVFL